MAYHVAAAEWSGRNDPEDGDLARRMHHLANAADAPVALIGFCCDAGISRNKGHPGAAQGPAAIRMALSNLAASAQHRGFLDAGDVVVAEEDPAPGQKELGKHVAGLLANHKRVVILGGGHETAFGSWSGLRRAHPSARIGIVNIDAHLDLRTVGPAGASSGTPFWQIQDAEPESFTYAVLGVADEANTAALMERARDWSVDIVPDHHLQSSAEPGFHCIDRICSESDLVYLTIDLDVLPGSLAPGVSAPAARGVPLCVVEALIDRVMISGKLAVTDIVELCPPRDPAGLTARCAAYLARRLMQTGPTES
ncbi:formimidoylglutamase [Paracoccus aerodenitrificans]|uniref:formimidoylglutamase n=1 Tax=Paracoccus aerodenitrificans TaxID=3017781 RepID=UPI0022F0C567|nr:formimidoylglutamase [Paracoccus aerodenitrificans]WBU65450.1 formimidoylglutamase [Paracoccus aerodenitrificans]